MPRPQVSIILADDHALVRQGIRRIIQEDPGLKVIQEAGDGEELLNLLAHHQPDVVILDISMPRLRGLEAARIIKERYPKIKIVILTMHREMDYFDKAVEVGVEGYVIKEEADTDLNYAIRTVLSGKTYTSPYLWRSSGQG